MNNYINARQLEHEIKWLNDQITKLEIDITRRPRRQKQIDTYRHQIKHTELTITFGRNQ